MSKPHRDCDDDTITIIINGRKHQLSKHEVSFAEIVSLAFPGQSQGGNICFTIVFKRGPADQPEGTLVEGDIVKIRDGMVFNVTRTDKS
ncbi:MAG: hypothetical protein GY725_08985 [bacterium]|nr:hypothetical protein [bacterium]